MPSMSVPAALMVGSSVIGGVGSVMAGNAQGGSLDARAASEKSAGIQAVASAQRQGLSEAQKGRFVASTAKANLTAGGGGAADPTSINILANIKGQADYNQLSALYEGQEQNREYDMQAASDQQQADQARQAGWINGFSTILSGGNSLYSKYGG